MAARFRARACSPSSLPSWSSSSSRSPGPRCSQGRPRGPPRRIGTCVEAAARALRLALGGDARGHRLARGVRRALGSGVLRLEAHVAGAVGGARERLVAARRLRAGRARAGRKLVAALRRVGALERALALRRACLRALAVRGGEEGPFGLRELREARRLRRAARETLVVPAALLVSEALLGRCRAESAAGVRDLPAEVAVLGRQRLRELALEEREAEGHATADADSVAVPCTYEWTPTTFSEPGLPTRTGPPLSP